LSIEDIYTGGTKIEAIANKYIHKSLGYNGVMKHFEGLHKLVKKAVTMDWLEKDTFAKFKLRFNKT